MKILYGIQGTGQGHISRARAMAQAFIPYDVDVQWLFSGRERTKFFDMDLFGDYAWRRGLTFSAVDGHIDHLRTVFENNLPVFLRDVMSLRVQDYDLVVTDYEPVTAWACKLHNVRCIGIGHQYAFGKTTPRAGDDWLSRAIMRNFAPVHTGLGLHWHRYDDSTLPPILDLGSPDTEHGDYYLVYLPFEDQDTVSAWLNAHQKHNFVQYAPGLQEGQQRNVYRHPTCIVGFKRDLHRCRGVICNSGFELISECLELGKPALTKPLAGQTEQLSNALALTQLGYATAMDSLDHDALAQWLDHAPRAPRVHFADVAAGLAEWLCTGAKESPETLSQALWRASTTPRLTLKADASYCLLPQSA